jgi:hypothetical protein
MGNISLRLGAAIIGVFLTTALVAGGAYAFGGWAKFRGNNELKTAIEKNDYAALGENPKITQDQFNKMVEAANLMKEGKNDEAKKLMQDAGLGSMGLGMGREMMGHGMRGMKFDPAKQEAVTKALDANDYDAWLAAVGADSPLAQKINKDNFSRYVEAYNHMKQAKVIMEELGLDQGMGMSMGMGRPGMGWFK